MSRKNIKIILLKYLQSEEVEEHVKNFQRDFEGALQHLLHMKARLGSNASESKDLVYWYLTALFGETVFRAYIQWAENALEILKKLHPNIETG